MKEIPRVPIVDLCGSKKIIQILRKHILEGTSITTA